MTTAIVARMKDASLTVMKLLRMGVLIHIIVLTAPVIIPARTPSPVVLGHLSESNSAGPKDAPNPLQAYETIVNINFFETTARIKAMIPTRRVINREVRKSAFWDIFFLNVLW